MPWNPAGKIDEGGRGSRHWLELRKREAARGRAPAPGKKSKKVGVPRIDAECRKRIIGGKVTLKPVATSPPLEIVNARSSDAPRAGANCQGGKGLDKKRSQPQTKKKDREIRFRWEGEMKRQENERSSAEIKRVQRRAQFA